MQTTLAQFNEVESQDAFSLQNSKLLKVPLDQVTIQAKLGSMVAYQGDVTFEHAGSGGMGRMLKKAVTGEGQSLMKMTGSGEVFLADTAQDIHLIYLEDDKITVNGPNLLAFDAGIDWDIERVQGASGMMGGGLFNTVAAAARAGWRSSPTARRCCSTSARRPTFADAAGRDHLVVGRRRRRMKTDFKLKNLIGQRLGRDDPDGLPGPGLGARAAVRGPRHGGRRRGRRRRRRLIGNLPEAG